MDELEYAIEAKNILDEFYEVDKILYVEGVEDKAFWGTLFENYYSGNVEIIEVSGIENLKIYVEQIENGQLSNAFVACDQDYNLFFNKIWHNNVICTYGHSIENSLIYMESVVDLVRGYAKFYKKELIRNRYEEWIDHFHCHIIDLIYCDIYNEKNKLGFSVLNHACERYFTSKKSFYISPDSISEHISSFFDVDSMNEIRCEMDGLQEIIREKFIRGHFLFSAAMRFVTVLSTELANKKISIAKDAFFASTLISFEKNLSLHPHKDFYQNKIANL